MIFALALGASAQKIIVDSTSSKNYLIKKSTSTEQVEEESEPNFSDRALSIGKGIINRLKARLNLEEAGETFKNKKEKILGRSEEKQGSDPEDDDGDG